MDKKPYKSIVFKINHFYEHFMNKKTTFFVHAWGEEGEEKHPPVGKEINRPKCPKQTSPLAMRFLIPSHAWGPRKLGLHAWNVTTL